MFWIGSITTYLLALSSNDGNPFINERLAGGYDLVQQADALVKEEKFDEASELYRQGLWMGRKITLSLQEEQQQDDVDDDPAQALTWLIESHIKSSKANLAFGDLEKARGDAWAACVYSLNTNIDALQCMLKVCQDSNDIFGEYSTLKSLLQLEPIPDDNGGDDNEQKTVATIPLDERRRMALRIAELDEELSAKSNSRS